MIGLRDILEYIVALAVAALLLACFANFLQPGIWSASAIEAQRAETTKIGSVEDESAVPNGETPK